jgi:hypothetical protein
VRSTTGADRLIEESVDHPTQEQPKGEGDARDWKRCDDHVQTWTGVEGKDVYR